MVLLLKHLKEEHSEHCVPGLQHWDFLFQEPGVRVGAEAHWCILLIEEHSEHRVSGLQHWDVLQDAGVKVEAGAHWWDQ